MSEKNGVVYITFKRNPKAHRYRELRHSVESLKKIHPKLSVTLFTNDKFKADLSMIDHIKIYDINSDRVKQDLLYDSPYENTLYMDCDTEIVGPIDEIFNLMGRFDIAAVQDQIRKDPKKSAKYPDYASIPDGFPEYAGGVILFRKCDEVKNFFKVWRNNYNKWLKLTGEVRDQPSFRVTLWQCKDLKLHSLPPEFNWRTKKKHNIITRIDHRHDLWRKK
jgi:hypothetical protein